MKPNIYVQANRENPDIERLAYSRKEAAWSLGISEGSLDTLIRDPASGFPFFTLDPEKDRSRVMIPVRELMDWLAIRAGYIGADAPDLLPDNLCEDLAHSGKI